MILSAILLYSPIPPVNFPDQLQGAWDETEYTCSQPSSVSRLAILGSKFFRENSQGYATDFKKLDRKVFVARILYTRSKRTVPLVRRYELSEDSSVMFVQSYTINKKNPLTNAQIYIRCSDQDKALEQFK